MKAENKYKLKSDSDLSERSEEIKMIKSKAKEIKSDMKNDYEEQMKDLRSQQKLARENLKTGIKEGNETCRKMKDNIHDYRKKLSRDSDKASSKMTKKGRYK